MRNRIHCHTCKKIETININIQYFQLKKNYKPTACKFYIFDMNCIFYEYYKFNNSYLFILYL